MIAVRTLLIFLILSAGCTDQPVPAKQDANLRMVTDCAGRDVLIPNRVEKVVDLALLDGTRTMVELQAADKLVGVNDSVSISCTERRAAPSVAGSCRPRWRRN